MGWREESTRVDSGFDWKNQSTRVQPIADSGWRSQSTQSESKKETEAAKFRIAETEHILKNARRQLKGSWIRDVFSVQQQTAFGLLSLAQRTTGFGNADKSKRIADAYAQASAELDKNHPLGIIPEAARGAAVSLAQTGPAGMAGGPFGMIAAASILETNQAITEGRDADLSGAQLAAYAGMQGVIEGAPAAVLSRFGLHGIEGMFGKAASKVMAKGVASTMARFGFQTAVETGENVFTEIGHSVASVVADVNEDALKSENIYKTIQQATAQSLITMGMVGSVRAGLSKAESSQMAKTLKTQETILQMAEAGDTPSRKEWLKLGFPAKEGMAQQQRKAGVQQTAAFIMETRQQQEQAAEAARAQREAPVADEGAVQGVEAPEVAQQPEAIVEEPEAVQEGEGFTFRDLTQEEREQATAAWEAEAIEAEEGALPAEPVQAEAIKVEDAESLTIEEMETISLTKAEGAEIRRLLDQPDLPEGQRQSRQSVVDEVAESGGWRDAVQTAQKVIANPRQTTSHEHVAFMLKTGKLVNELKNTMADKAAAVESGDQVAYSDAMRESGEITAQIDILTTADKFAGSEMGRAFGIRQLKLRLEDFSIVGVLQQMQSLKKTGQRVSKKERDDATEATGELADANTKLTEVEQTLKEEDVVAEAKEAEGVLKATKKRGKIGQKIAERARADREAIKKALRDMGHQVHDITGITIEGTYLIGRLGISYIQEGTGTLVEVMERLRNDLPGLDLTQQDVNKALITKKPGGKMKARSAAKKREANLVAIARAFDGVDNLINGIEVKVKKREPIAKEVKAAQKFLWKIRNKVFEAEIDADKKERAMDRISRLKSQLETGELAYNESNRESPSPELLVLRQQARDITKEINLNAELKSLRTQFETGDFIIPEKRVQKPIDPRLEDAQIEVNRMRRKIRNLIADAAPWDAEKVFDEGTSIMKSLKGTGEASFTLRQLAAQVLAHPWQIGKRIPASLKAGMSVKQAEKIQNAIANAPNFNLYLRHKLVILDADSPQAQERAEGFTRNLAERIPAWGAVIRASSRQSVAISNLARTDAFDRYVDGVPHATREELNAFADAANKSTGIGDISGLGPTAIKWLVRSFFAPKFVASRVQTPLVVFKYWKLPRVRKMMAKEMVRGVGASLAILKLAVYAGGHVEWWDVDDPDWMKIRFGDSRLDIFGSHLQYARAIARIAKVGVLSAQGLESDSDPFDVVFNMATYKFSPAITLTYELLKGKTVIGEEISKPEALMRSLIPMAAGDIEDAAKNEESIGIIATTPLVFFGEGITTYQDSESAVRRKAKRRMRIAATLKPGKEKDALLAEVARMISDHNRRDPENIIASINIK